MEITKNKRLFLLLILILIIEAGWAVWYLTTSQNSRQKGRQASLKSQKPVTSQAKEMISLSLSPSTGEFQIGEIFQVAIVLSVSEKQAIGADAIIKYDPKKLAVLAIIPGQIFDFYPQLEKQSGKVFISAINQNQKAFSGQGILAQLKLQGKTEAKTKLIFEFEADQTTDSNVAIKNSYQDALEQVKNGSYTFE